MYGFMHSLVLSVPMNSITTEHLAGILMGIYLSIYLCYVWEVDCLYLFEYFFSPAPILSFLRHY